MINYLLLFCITAFIFYHIGYTSAHYTVSTECEKLGSFYVGDKVYECKRKE